MKIIKILFIFFMMFSLYGCASTITAKPGGSSGIPYYLPKPYLLIARNLCLVQTKTTEIKEDNKTVITTEPVSSCNKENDSFSFQVIYLPDLTQKHSLKILSRTGTIDTSISFVDGWKFTGLNLNADAKTSETISAIGSIVSKLPMQTRGVPSRGAKEEPEAGLWLYEIRLEDGRIKYDLVIEWKP